MYLCIFSRTPGLWETCSC